MNDDVIKNILNTNEFAEDIIYLVKDGTQKNIKAVIDRNRIDSGSEDDGRSLSKDIEVIISKDSVNGISSVNVGLDKVKLPEYLGSTSIEWRVVEILKHDDAIWHLLCVK